MRQIAQNKQHHWHFSPMTLPYSFSNASNKQQQPPWKAQNKATPTTLVTVTFRKPSMCCRHFPSRDSNPVFASKREHSTLHWLIQCYFRAVVLGSGKKFTFNFTINKKRDRIKDTMSFAGFKKQINKANQVRKGMKKDEALTRLFDRHHNVSLSPHNSCEFDFHLMWQFMSEKIGGAKGSTLEEDFVELERVSFFLFFWFCFEVSIPHMFTLSPLRCSCIRTCELPPLF